MSIRDGLSSLMAKSLARMGAANEAHYSAVRGRPYAGAILRTPDLRFEGLPGWDFPPRYVTVNGLRVHYVDEGPPAAAPVLLLHGEPSWSYLYRKMIPPLAAAGHRVIAPDLIGFGRSDKLPLRRDYSYQFQVDVVTGFITSLGLSEITLFCQDWGGLIGLRVAAENEGRFARIMAANTALVALPSSFATAEARAIAAKTLAQTAPGFLAWLTASQAMPRFDAGRVVQFGTVTRLDPATVAAYNAPFPDKTYTAGPRAYPTLVGSQPTENAAAWRSLTRWQKPFLTAFSDRDPILKNFAGIFRQLVPGAADQPHVTIRGGGHFLQEDKGEELARMMVEWMR